MKKTFVIFHNRLKMTRLEMYIKINFNKLSVPYTCVNGAVDVYVLMNKKGGNPSQHYMRTLEKRGYIQPFTKQVFSTPT